MFLSLAGCAMLGGSSGTAAPEGNDPPFVYAGARMHGAGGQVTAVTLCKTDGKREKVSLRWTGGFDLFDSRSSFYREMIEPGQYRLYTVHFETGGKTYIEEVGENFRTFEIKPEGIQFLGEILVEKSSSSFSFRMGGAEVNRRAVLDKVINKLRRTDWAPVLEKHRKSI